MFGNLFKKKNKQAQTSAIQQNQNTYAKNKTSGFKSKEEYTKWKEEKLSNTQVSKNSICPHCEESISANVLVCPFCAEDVRNNTLPSPDELNPIKTRMKKLEALLADGIITQEEFNSQKQQLIDKYLNT